MGLIQTLEYAPYFLTVNSIVRFARSQDILCQGRGSAANSAVCYVLGITSIDPERNDLLFERFVSEERREPPDIDVNFETSGARSSCSGSGAPTAATTPPSAPPWCDTATPRGDPRRGQGPRASPEDLTKMLSSQTWGWSEESVQAKHAEELNLNLGAGACASLSTSPAS